MNKNNFLFDLSDEQKKVIEENNFKDKIIRNNINIELLNEDNKEDIIKKFNELKEEYNKINNLNEILQLKNLCLKNFLIENAAENNDEYTLNSFQKNKFYYDIDLNKNNINDLNIKDIINYFYINDYWFNFKELMNNKTKNIFNEFLKLKNENPIYIKDIDYFIKHNDNNNLNIFIINEIKKIFFKYLNIININDIHIDDIIYFYKNDDKYDEIKDLTENQIKEKYKKENDDNIDEKINGLYDNGCENGCWFNSIMEYQ